MNFVVYFQKTFNEKNKALYLFLFLLMIEYLVTYFYFINKTNWYFKSIFPFVFAIVLISLFKLKKSESHNTKYHLYKISILNQGNYFLYIGIFIFLSTFFAELLIFDSTLSDNSFFAFLLSSWLIIFNRIDDKFYFEREWLLLLFIFLFLLSQSLKESTGLFCLQTLFSLSFIGNDLIVNIFLAKPTSAFTISWLQCF